MRPLSTVLTEQPLWREYPAIQSHRSNKERRSTHSADQWKNSRLGVIVYGTSTSAYIDLRRVTDRWLWSTESGNVPTGERTRRRSIDGVESLDCKKKLPDWIFFCCQFHLIEPIDLITRGHFLPLHPAPTRYANVLRGVKWRADRWRIETKSQPYNCREWNQSTGSIKVNKLIPRNAQEWMKFSSTYGSLKSYSRKVKVWDIFVDFWFRKIEVMRIKFKRQWIVGIRFNSQSK